MFRCASFLAALPRPPSLGDITAAAFLLWMLVLGSSINNNCIVTVDAQPIQGGASYSYSQIPKEQQEKLEYTVILPNGHRHVVVLDDNGRQHQHRHLLHRRHRRHGRNMGWQQQEQDKQVQEQQHKQQEQDFRDLLWDDKKNTNVYTVERPDGTTHEVRYMVSEVMDNRRRQRCRLHVLEDGHGDAVPGLRSRPRRRDLGRFLDERKTRRPKRHPIPIGYNQVVLSSSSRHSSNHSSDHSSNLPPNMPLGQYKVILPNGHDQFVMVPSLSSSTTSATADALEADIAAWASEYFHMLPLVSILPLSSAEDPVLR